MKMKILVLVISSDTHPVYAKHREVWRSYMTKTPNVDVYFLEMGEALELRGDTLYVPGIESFRGIIYKTIDALKYFPIWRYDYILRSNMSTLWNFPRLLKHIESFPRRGLYAGTIGQYRGVTYISGDGILMSPDVCSLILINEEEVLNVDIIDDADIGKVLVAKGVQLHPIPRIDILSPLPEYDTTAIRYRVKMVYGDSRDREPEIMQLILKEW